MLRHCSLVDRGEARVNARAVQIGRGSANRALAKVLVVMRLLVAGLAEGVAEPLETFVETVTGGGAGRLDVLFQGSSVLVPRLSY